MNIFKKIIGGITIVVMIIEVYNLSLITIYWKEIDVYKLISISDVLLICTIIGIFTVLILDKIEKDS